ncbi:hypothetical protein L484_014680 [Morus notabilis]|uniref:Uncharacterized protein n=1 Tax=Morus notabilis TaxID=981085 RepID=W9SBY3_9ROSA|nr:hypothetical protein L484_014680 [Morus notabilis]
MPPAKTEAPETGEIREKRTEKGETGKIERREQRRIEWRRDVGLLYEYHVFYEKVSSISSFSFIENDFFLSILTFKTILSRKVTLIKKESFSTNSKKSQQANFV